jgi:dTDP-4-dehydrorhamnose reductase
MTLPHILVLGSTGQLGQALASVIPRKEFRVTSLSRSIADLSKPESLPSILDKYHPEWVINAAAYTDVTRAEQEEALATVINGKAPGVIAHWCADRKIPFIHYSTDYVFGGNGTVPNREDTPVNPMNAYGRSKLAGEKEIAEAGGNWMVLRTSWVYAEKGKNFLLTMLKLGKEREELQIVGDQWGSPTYASDLAQGTVEVIRKVRARGAFPTGIFHLCNGGETTWHGFAEAIFESARSRGIPLKVKKIIPVKTSEYPSPVNRPLNSRLSGDKLKTTLEVVLRPWRQALAACMERIG